MSEHRRLFDSQQLTSFLLLLLTFDIPFCSFDVHDMSLSKLGVFASLALAANAVLIPPTITADDLGDDVAMEGLVINPFKRSVALECPGCAFATQEEASLSWEENAGSTFVCILEPSGYARLQTASRVP